MRRTPAITRSGLARPQPVDRERDPRIHVDLAHLRTLEGSARSLSFLPRQKARSVLNGRHGSKLRGRGLNFEELRQYQPGDDIRTIDWKVTARTGEPHVRVYTEERDRPALLVIDQRMSMFFGSTLNMKSVTAAETAALIAFRILEQKDRLGAIIVTDDEVIELRPQRSRKALDRFLNALAHANQALNASKPAPAPPHMNDVFRSVARIARRDHLVVAVSDFDGTNEQTPVLLGGIARHNDVILATVTDPVGRDVPENLKLVASDGLLQAELDTREGATRTALERVTRGRMAEILSWQSKLGTPVLPLDAAQDTLTQIQRLMGVLGARR